METHLTPYKPIQGNLPKPFNPIVYNELLAGIFFNLSAILMAHQKLLTSGYRNQDINLVMTTETWHKHFSDFWEGGFETENDRHAHKCAHPSWQNVSEIKALIRKSKVMPGLDLLVAGPIAHLLTKQESTQSGTGIIGAFQNWGLPKMLSEQFEKVVLCGGIMIGVGIQEGATATSLEYEQHQRSGARVQLLSANGSMEV